MKNLGTKHKISQECSWFPVLGSQNGTPTFFNSALWSRAETSWLRWVTLHRWQRKLFVMIFQNVLKSMLLYIYWFERTAGKPFKLVLFFWWVVGLRGWERFPSLCIFVCLKAPLKVSCEFIWSKYLLFVWLHFGFNSLSSWHLKNLT
jgi:hypothetical protein